MGAFHLCEDLIDDVIGTPEGLPKDLPRDTTVAVDDTRELRQDIQKVFIPFERSGSRLPLQTQGAVCRIHLFFPETQKK
jgi:hypothetical protein